MMVPPIAPTIRIGAWAFVMSASGMLSSNPKAKPTIQPGQGKATQLITNPMANRLVNAASNAVALSGNDIGSIIATDTAPKISPLIIP